jgi:hypothetical protein
VASGELVAARDGHRISICSIVSSGLNAPLPSENTLRGDMADTLTLPLLDPAGAPLGSLSYATVQACDEDSAASVDLQLASNGTGNWEVHVQFLGRDSAPSTPLAATVTL